jgi:hypothetical protein
MSILDRICRSKWKLDVKRSDKLKNFLVEQGVPKFICDMANISPGCVMKFDQSSDVISVTHSNKFLTFKQIYSKDEKEHKQNHPIVGNILTQLVIGKKKIKIIEKKPLKTIVTSKIGILDNNKILVMSITLKKHDDVTINIKRVYFNI